MEAKIKMRFISSPMNILTNIKDFVKNHLDDIILIIGVILISLLSFAMGYIVAKQQEKELLKIKEITHNDYSYNRSGNQWALSGLEAFQDGS